MGQFSFKSSGTTQAATIANQLPQTAPPIGIATPVALGDNDLLKTNTDIGAQMSDNLRNLILTNWGERLGLYDFGANLRPLVTDLVSQDDFDSQAITRIQNAVSKWMPYVQLHDFISAIDRKQNQHTAVVLLTITYSIPSLGVKNRKLQVTLYAI